MQKAVMDLQLSGVRVGLVISAIVVIATTVAGLLVVRAVDHAFARESAKVDSIR